MQPPPSIDGARVLEWSWSDVPFGVVPCSGEYAATFIHGLAICQYEGDTAVYYRFSCNAFGECEQNQTYDSVEQAKSELPDQHRNVPALWKIGAAL